MKKLSLLLLSLIAVNANAGYRCAVTLQQSSEYKSADGSTGRFFAFNVNAITRVFDVGSFSTESGSVAGSDFFKESKKSEIAFYNVMIGWAGQEEATITFVRHSEPNKYKIFTKHDKLAEVQLKGNEMKTVVLDADKLRAVVACGIAEIESHPW